MQKAIFGVIALLFTSLSGLSAQASPLPCGLQHEHAQAIKARMLAQRERIGSADLQRQRQNRSITYIPVTLHLVGTTDGGSLPNFGSSLGMICRLNADFADQDIQFYWQPPVRYLLNSAAYRLDDDWPYFTNKVANTLNVYVNSNSSPDLGVAGYYDPGYDYVYMNAAYANTVSNTITHEVGHFFTLPHTFYGWEGINATTMPTSNAPLDLGNGHGPPEYVTRTGSNTNCLTAADGFCDTPADYLSFRIRCPFNSSAVRDPDGQAIIPDAQNFMSYFYDECVNRFSQEQKDAMLRDIIARNWTNFPAPVYLPFTPGYSHQILNPLEGQAVPVNGSLDLSWQAISGARGYWIEVERTLSNGIPLDMVFSGLVEGQEQIRVPGSVLRASGHYRWRIRAFNVVEGCEPHSPWFRFSVSELTLALNPVQASSAWTILGAQPLLGRNLRLQGELALAEDLDLQLYDFSGRLLSRQTWADLSAGTQQVDLQLQSLPAGLYVLRLQGSKTGAQTLRLVLGEE